MKDDACTCLTCGGVGFCGASVISGWECEDCSGTGWVPVDREALDEIELTEGLLQIQEEFERGMKQVAVEVSTWADWKLAGFRQGIR